jgi:cytochrome c556
MSNLFRRGAAALTIGCLALVLAVGASARPADSWTVSEVMKKVNGKKGAVGKASTAVKDGKWDDAATAAKDIKKGGEDLSKNTAPKGEKESWTKLTKSYAESTKAMSDAVEKKDKEAYDKAAKAVGGSCKTCHDAHK